MAHQLYQTQGLIIGWTNVGEADRYYQILTKDLGLITAMAQGVRVLSAKFRCYLQFLRLNNLTVVRGREVWRIVGVDNLKWGEEIWTNSQLLGVAARLGKLVRRLVVGEHPDEQLFWQIKEMLMFLPLIDNPESLRVFELIANLRLLNLLGYGNLQGKYKKFITGPLSLEFVSSVIPEQKILASLIKQILQITHL